MYKPYGKNKFNCFDSDKRWPNSIKNKIQWLPFLTIIEYTANKMQENKGLISIIIEDVCHVRNKLELWK